MNDPHEYEYRVVSTWGWASAELQSLDEVRHVRDVNAKGFPLHTFRAQRRQISPPHPWEDCDG